jgi:hypothetical protein
MAFARDLAAHRLARGEALLDRGTIGRKAVGQRAGFAGGDHSFERLVDVLLRC